MTMETYQTVDLVRYIIDSETGFVDNNSKMFSYQISNVTNNCIHIICMTYKRSNFPYIKVLCVAKHVRI
jgi:hypothetical protein